MKNTIFSYLGVVRKLNRKEIKQKKKIKWNPATDFIVKYSEKNRVQLKLKRKNYYKIFLTRIT